MTLANNGTGMDHFLTPTEYLDAGHPLVRTTAATLIRDAVSDTERVRRIYYYVRDVPYDVLASFRYLAQGHHRASDVIGHGVAFCMGKASSFVASEPPVSRPVSRSRRSTPPIRSFCPRRYVPYGEAELAGPSRGTRWVRHILVGDGSSWTPPSTHPPPPASASPTGKNSTELPRSRRWKEPSCGKTAATPTIPARSRNGTNESLSRS
ncbi:hypothetical protein AN70_00825 [Mycobacterium tuberculosis M1272]|nr:hypothetical protein AN70_00825 [Mycobacterium tuberculosis M1272]KAZ81569.1 hypothetical protein AO06_00824 [Mycobacterium tuberculosis M1425]